MSSQDLTSTGFAALFRVSLLLGLFSPFAQAESLARYLDVNTSGMHVEVRINDFPVYQSGNWSGESYSVFLGSLLKDGKNTISWAARSGPAVTRENKPGWAQVEIMEAPADAMRSSEDPGKALYSKRILPLGSLDLLPDKSEANEVLTGSLDPKNGAAFFREIAPRRWAWGIRLKQADQTLSGHLTKIYHARISDSLVRAELHLLQSGTDRHVVYDDLRFPRGGGETILTDDMASRGARFLRDGKFDTVWIFGTAAEGVKDLSLAMFSLETLRESYREEAELQVEIGHPWAWQSADTPGDLSKPSDERQSLVDFLRSVHAAMNEPTPENWTPFFETKVSELAKATGKPIEELAAEQQDFFQKLAAIEGWELEPFDEDRLIVRRANPQLIEVSYVDSGGPIQSIPLPKPGEPEQLDRLTIPLFLSRVDGKWTIVR